MSTGLQSIPIQFNSFQLGNSHDQLWQLSTVTDSSYDQLSTVTDSSYDQLWPVITTYNYL